MKFALTGALTAILDENGDGLSGDGGRSLLSHVYGWRGSLLRRHPLFLNSFFLFYFRVDNFLVNYLYKAFSWNYLERKTKKKIKMLCAIDVEITLDGASLHFRRLFLLLSPTRPTQMPSCLMLITLNHQWRLGNVA